VSFDSLVQLATQIEVSQQLMFARTLINKA